MKTILSNELKMMIQNEETFIIKFFTEGCPNCAMMAPQYELASNKSDIPFIKINGEEELEELKEFGVMAFPTTIVFIKGEEKSRFGGFMNEAQIISMIKASQEGNKEELAKLADVEKTAIQCGTIAAIEVKDEKLYIQFWDGSIREYSDIDPIHVETILDINGFASVGSYYRTNIRPNYEYVEVQAATNNINLEGSK